MSRIGKAPVVIPGGVEVKITDGLVEVKGAKGKLSFDFGPKMSIELKDGSVIVTRPNDEKENRSLHGMTRALIQNMVTGVTEGFSKTLVMVGVGYKANLGGKNLVVNAGYSHPVELEIPEGISVECPKATEIIVRGIDKQMVGSFASNIRKVRPPEPYKGKGIKYSTENVRRKVGKTGAK